MKFSVIIPTFGRPTEVIERTILSVLDSQTEFNQHIVRIILVDQNIQPLELSSLSSKINYVRVKASELHALTLENPTLLHVYGIDPSVTKAKNIALKHTIGDGLLFLDDDVVLSQGSIREFDQFLSTHPDASFVGGRETVMPVEIKRSRLKRALSGLAALIFSKDPEFVVQNQYIGRVKPNSIFLCNFSLQSEVPIKIDTARGCIWAARTSQVEAVGGFDECFSGTAVREESDLHLRLRDRFGPAYFLSKAHAFHYRQLGGCNNLDQNIATFKSKLKNEYYFQQKHFSHISKIWFFLRLLPLALESLKNTSGQSLVLLIKKVTN